MVSGVIGRPQATVEAGRVCGSSVEARWRTDEAAGGRSAQGRAASALELDRELRGPGTLMQCACFTHQHESYTLTCMTTRLQVLLEDDEIAEIRRVAKLHRMTVAEWVRQALRAARRDQPQTDARRKLAAVREAAAGAYPTADIAQMLIEIEGEYLLGDER